MVHNTLVSSIFFSLSDQSQLNLTLNHRPSFYLMPVFCWVCEKMQWWGQTRKSTGVPLLNVNGRSIFQIWVTPSKSLAGNEWGTFRLSLFIVGMEINMSSQRSSWFDWYLNYFPSVMISPMLTILWPFGTSPLLLEKTGYLQRLWQFTRSRMCFTKP